MAQKKRSIVFIHLLEQKSQLIFLMRKLLKIITVR